MSNTELETAFSQCVKVIIVPQR